MTPQGEIVANFYFERLPLPKVVEQRVNPEGKLGEVVDKEVEKDGMTVPEDRPRHWKEKGVNSYIKYFGVEAVRKALEEEDIVEYLKTLVRKYK